jgi:hypothetical protein
MYLTVEDVKKSQVAALVELPDDFIIKRLEILSGVIDEYCNTRFVPTEIEWRTDLKRKVRTLKRPLISVNELMIQDNLLEEDLDYYVYPERNLIEFEDILEYKRRKKTLYIKYVYGHEEVPAIVKEVLLELFKDSIEGSNVSGRVKSEQWEDYQYTLADGSQSIKGILSMLDRFIEDEEEIIENSNKIRAMLL